MMLQLDPSIPVTTPLGRAQAHVLIHHGIEQDLQWVCFQDDTGEVFAWPSNDVRALENLSVGRGRLDSESIPALSTNGQTKKHDRTIRPNTADRIVQYMKTTAGIHGMGNGLTVKQIAAGIKDNYNNVYQHLKNHSAYFEKVPRDGNRGMNPDYWRLVGGQWGAEVKAEAEGVDA